VVRPKLTTLPSLPFYLNKACSVLKITAKTVNIYIDIKYIYHTLILKSMGSLQQEQGVRDLSVAPHWCKKANLMLAVSNAADTE
jgi:hypothetical protein